MLVVFRLCKIQIKLFVFDFSEIFFHWQLAKQNQINMVVRMVANTTKKAKQIYRHLLYQKRLISSYWQKYTVRGGGCSGGKIRSLQNKNDFNQSFTTVTVLKEKNGYL